MPTTTESGPVLQRRTRRCRSHLRHRRSHSRWTDRRGLVNLIRSISQGGSTTTFDLDATGRRRTATTTGTGAHTLVRHYTDGGDNPGWEEHTVGGVTTTTRFVESIGGDLGLTITSSGDASIPLANLHGDVVTSVPLPASTASNSNATSITGWSDYDEYGNQRDSAAAAVVGGPAGYAWLGAKQRATTATGLQLMGVRVYNPATGTFLQVDPIKGGNANDYEYCSADPINCTDLDGRWGFKKIFKKAAQTVWKYRKGIALTALMFVPGLGQVGMAARLGQFAFKARGIGGASRLFGNSSWGRAGGGVFNKAHRHWAVGWGRGPHKSGVAAPVFRIKHPKLQRGKLDLLWGRFD